MYDLSVSLERMSPRLSGRAGLSRRPLTASAADQAMFVDRAAETEAIRSAIDLGLNTFVTGPAGSGKTSMLRHVQRRLDGYQAVVVYVNLEAARSIGRALESIVREVNPDTGARRSRFAMVEDETDLVVVEEAVAARVGSRPMVLLADGASVEVATVLFGRYRDRLWDRSPQVRWVVASRHRFPPPPADAFFDRVVELGPFPPLVGADLLEKRVPETSAETRRQLAAAVGAAQPVFWMMVAQRLALASEEPDTIITTLAAQRAASEELTSRLRTLYETIRELGPVHAGDRELLERVRASRPWVVTGLKKLEKYGLVRSERDSRRVLYEVLPNWLTRPAGHNTTTSAGELPTPNTAR